MNFFLHMAHFTNVVQCNPSMYNNDIHYKAWYEITNPLPNFNDETVEVWVGINNSIPIFYRAYDYLYMLRLKLIHASKTGPVMTCGVITIP